MSINGVYAAVNQEELDGLVSNPNKLLTFWPNRRQAMFQESKEMAKKSTRFLDLDQYCEELHILLTGEEVPSDAKGPVVTDNPFSLAIAGGQPIEETNTGYGPVRILKPEQVDSIAKAVTKLEYDALCSKHDMQDCPEEYFEAFKQFFTETATAKDFILAAFV